MDGSDSYKKVCVRLSDTSSGIIQDIIKSCGLRDLPDVFNAAIDKTVDVMKIRQDGYTIIGIDGQGIVRHVMEDEKIATSARADKENIAQIGNIYLTPEAVKQGAPVMQHYGIKSEERTLKFMLDVLAELMEMRRAGLTIYGYGPLGLKYVIKSQLLDRAEEAGRPGREAIARLMRPAPSDGPKG